MKSRSRWIVLAVLLAACGGEDAEEANSSEPPAAEGEEAAAEEPAAPAEPELASVISCSSPFGFCHEWTGANLEALGADDAAREAAARSSCRGSTLQVGTACSREQQVGTCTETSKVTIFTATDMLPAERARETGQSTCASSHGTWEAVQ